MNIKENKSALECWMFENLKGLMIFAVVLGFATGVVFTTML
jgi:hypothetical protein